MGSERAAGPFLLLSPLGWVNPAHEHQAIGLASSDRRRPQQLHTHGYGLVTATMCSRAEWMQFVAAVKAGKLDVTVPGEGDLSPDERTETVAELADFLATGTRLATADPGIADMIAERLYDAGWRKVAGDG